MSDDDDRLADIDLTAWEAPPAPAGLADAVIERMGATNVNVALPVETAPQPRRAWVVVGAAAAAVALAGVVAVGVWSLGGATQPAAPATGGIVAERAQTLSIDTVRANLDPGADVRWRRDGDALHVEQRAGTVAWHVDKNDKLVIAAGAGLARVEAAGANLRVEVQMNAMDVRVIGASALTAAAVAMVTVVVYEGHVKVARGSQPAVVVAPGSTQQIKQEAPPPVVGGSVATVAPPCDAEALKEQAMELINRGEHAKALEQLELSLDCKDDPYVRQLAFMEACSSGDSPKAKHYYKQLTPAQQQKFAMICIRQNVAYRDDDAADATCDEVSCVLNNYAGACCDKYRRAASKQVKRDSAAKQSLDRAPSSAPPVCDAEKLRNDGMAYVNLGQHAAALAVFEKSLACKRDPYVLQLAFMEACSSRNAAKAKRYYKQLSPAQQQKFAQICIRMRTEYQ